MNTIPQYLLLMCPIRLSITDIVTVKMIDYMRIKRSRVYNVMMKEILSCLEFVHYL